MGNTEFIILIVFIVIAILLYKFLKPYFIKYDTTLLFTGGLGSGKTLNSVKHALICLRKMRFKVWFNNKLAKIFKKRKILQKPLLYSNIPIRISKKEISQPLTYEILTLKYRVIEYSVVLFDETPQFINQFNYNIKDVQYNLNEFIAFFRHYVGGYLILNAQAESEICKQMRAKLNSFYWCFNFQKFLFFFYRVKVIHAQISENNISNSSTFLDDNIKYTYGILPRKKYNTRAYKYRYYKIDLAPKIELITTDLFINVVNRFDIKYTTPLDYTFNFYDYSQVKLVKGVAYGYTDN